VFGEAPQPIISDGKIDWDQRAARLVTCDRPVFNDDDRRALSATADLVDMEGAAIARVAAMYQVPWTMIKGITDAAGPQDRASLNANLGTVSEKIGDVLWEKLQHL
jgi:nucleoside phosphorylase